MRWLKGSLGAGALILGLVLVAGATSGSFRGTIVDNPDATKNWIYVQARNGSARRVEISNAKIVYDEDVPAANRRTPPEGALGPGTEVRVVAEQGSDGEWHATRIEILKPAATSKESESGHSQRSS